MKLKTYLKENNISYREIAKKLNMSHTTIHKYLSGSRSPSLASAMKIEKLTKGAVNLSSWERKNERTKS